MKRTASAIGKSNVLKGKNHERRVASLLTEWSGIKFRRRRVEGRDDATVMIDLVADVIPVDANCMYSIEAKSGSGFSVEALLANPVGSLFGQWWFQTCYDAHLLTTMIGSSFFPMLFFKPHPNHDWIAFSAFTIGRLRYKDEMIDRDKLCFPHMVIDEYSRLGKVNGIISHTNVKKPHTMTLDPVVICRWNDFARCVEPSSVVVTSREYKDERR